MKFLDLTGMGHMDPRAGTGMGFAANGNMVVVYVGNWEIFQDQSIDLIFQLLDVKSRRFVRETDHKTVIDIVMTATSQLLCGHAKLAEIFCGVCHQPVFQRVIDGLANLLRLWSKQSGTGDQYLFAHTDQ